MHVSTAGSPELSQSDSEMARKYFTFTFTHAHPRGNAAIENIEQT